jgi:hypothetical protein
MLKIVLMLAAIGHILCGVCDCLLGYSPSGRLDLKGGLKDADRMREVFQDMPLKWSFASIMLGVYAITIFRFGYLGLAAFVITLFIMIVSGRTSLPQWACVLNTLPLMVVLMPTKLPAKGNIAGTIR